MSPSSLLVALLLAPTEALVMHAAARPTVVSRARSIVAEEPPPPPAGSRLGGTIDQDGKSNVWVCVCRPRITPSVLFRGVASVPPHRRVWIKLPDMSSPPLLNLT